MALALILALAQETEGVSVSYDIGKNRYFCWQLGDGKEVTQNGLPRLVDVKKRSEVIGPLKPDSFGRGRLLIPMEMLKQDRRYLQILSYREPNGIGPAVSPIVSMPRLAMERVNGDKAGAENVVLPPAGFSAELLTEEKKMKDLGASNIQKVGNIPFALSEENFSQTLFLNAIVGALPSLLPMLAPAISSLISGSRPQVSKLKGKSPSIINSGGKKVGTDQLTTVGQIGQLAEQLLKLLGGSSQKVLETENLKKILQLIKAGKIAQANGQSKNASSLSNYSHAQVAPALLAALPALMPLLKQVLTPKTVQGVIDAPLKMTGQVIEGLKEFAKLGMEANPGVDDPALYQLLASMSLSSNTKHARNYKRVKSVSLSIDDLKTQMVSGRERTLYRCNSALQFPLSVQTPQIISDVGMILQIKQADDLRIVHEAHESVGDVSSGPLSLIPRVESTVVQSLDMRKEYIVVIMLLWRNSRGQLRGTSIQHSISLVGEYRFDRIEESGELIALKDRETYGDYWHLIWKTEFNHKTRKSEIQSTYYLTLDAQSNQNARMDTETWSERKGGRNHIELNSGYAYSPYALNHLLSRLIPDQASLEQSVLQALTDDDFVERFNQSAQHQGIFRGRPGDRAALWVYPEIKLQKLVLVKVSQINEHGNVTELSEVRVMFPMPVMLHFLGVITE